MLMAASAFRSIVLPEPLVVMSPSVALKVMLSLATKLIWPEVLITLGYAVQGGVLKGLGIRLRNAVARSNYRSDIDENRVILSYTWTLL